MSFINYYPNT